MTATACTDWTQVPLDPFQGSAWRLVDEVAITQVVYNASSNVTVPITADFINCDATTAAFVATLPTPVGNSGKQFTFKKIDSTSHAVTISAGTNTIDGANTRILPAQFGYVVVVSNDVQWEVVASNSAISPTVQRFTSSSGTYTTPADVKFLLIKLVAGGGGGSGSGTGGAPTGGTGGTTTFGTSLLTATGGVGGQINGPGGFGGTVTVNSPALARVSITGGIGQGPVSGDAVSNLGGGGGNSAFGGAGQNPNGTNGGIGSAGATNTGGGGGGGSTTGATYQCGAGGGAGGYIEALILNPSATYAYAVGAAGTGGTGGTGASALNGGAGGSGVIVVEEYYS